MIDYAERQKKIVEKRKEALENALESYKTAGGMNFELRTCEEYLQRDALNLALNLDMFAGFHSTRSLDSMIEHTERLRDACDHFIERLKDCKETFFFPEIEDEENETTEELSVLEIA